MSRGPLAFKETDVARAMRAAARADVGPFHVRIERRTGDIIILPGEGQAPQGVQASARPDDADLDAELEAWMQRQA